MTTPTRPPPFSLPLTRPVDPDQLLVEIRAVLSTNVDLAICQPLNGQPGQVVFSQAGAPLTGDALAPQLGALKTTINAHVPAPPLPSPAAVLATTLSTASSFADLRTALLTYANKTVERENTHRPKS